MSSGGQVVGGIVGAAAGFVVGGPAGAIYGAQLGIMAGGVLDPPKGPTVEGPRLGDLSVQTSTYGQFIPRTYGTIGLSGNVFWLENNQLKEVVRKKKSGGKGGGSSSTVKTYTYFATFAVGLCEGPIAGVRRIWVGPDLVYDAGSDDLETIISSNQASAKFTIYTGTDTQQPDPRMQAEMGVANCPAFRGLAYIVVKDLALADYGNSVAGAQVKVEIVNQSSTATSSRAFEAVLSEPGTFRGYIPPPTMDGPTFGSIIAENGIYSCSRSGIFSKTQTYPTAYDLPRRVIGAGYAYATSSILVNVDGSVYSAAIGQQFEVQKNASSNDVILWSSSSGGTVGDIKNISKGYEKTGLNIRGFCIDTQYVYAISGTTLHKLDIETLTTVSTVTLSGASYDASACYLSLDGGLIWLSPSNNGLLRGYNVSTGALVKSFSGIIYNETGTIGEPSAVIEGLLAKWSPTVNKIEAVLFSQVVESSVPLSNIVASEAVRSSIISPSDIDTSGLADSVTGFKVTATGSIRNAIEPLRGAWPFDVVQAGYKIKATSRGSSSVVTIPIGELAIDTQLTESREMDSQLPQNVTVKYIDRDRDYDANEQRAQRDNTEAVNSLVLELPVVLSATQSAQVADKLIRIYALEKSDFSFTLPAPYRYLEPGDVVTIATDDADYVLRLVSVNQTADGRLECAGRPSSATTYTSIAPGDGGQQGTATIPLAGTTVGLLIDCPVIDEGLQDAPGFAVGMNGYSAGWPGGILYRTADNGQTWDDLQALTGRATAGFASSTLAASAGNLIQRGGSLTVSLIGGTLESVTEAQMLNGANIAAYGVNGRWEVIRFQNATLNADGTYTLDTFWRGDKGTEWATGLHAVNDYFVLMTDPDLAFVGMPTDSIGQPRDYRSITAGADIDSAANVSFTYDGVNLETLSGVHPKGVRSAGDLAITWQRRTRVGGAWRDYVDASLGEESQAYEVDIMDGSTVKRTLTATTPSVLYTSAMQVTDFGSPQALVMVNIYQLSAVVGRGYKLEATL